MSRENKESLPQLVVRRTFDKVPDVGNLECFSRFTIDYSTVHQIVHLPKTPPAFRVEAIVLQGGYQLSTVYATGLLFRNTISSPIPAPASRHPVGTLQVRARYLGAGGTAGDGCVLPKILDRGNLICTEYNGVQYGLRSTECTYVRSTRCK